MKVFLDAHIHSRYSRATSREMTLENLSRFAAVKGLSLVGTGDFTHPKWLEEIGQTIVEDGDSGLYIIKQQVAPAVKFMLSAEVCTISTHAGERKRVHHVIWAPNIDTVKQVNDILQFCGSLDSDGRPILDLTPAHLVITDSARSPKMAARPTMRPKRAPKGKRPLPIHDMTATPTIMERVRPPTPPATVLPGLTRGISLVFPMRLPVR